MNYKTVLRHQPWLRFYNLYGISSRLLRITKGNVFIAYDTIREIYELHSVRAYKINRVSANAPIDQEFLNGFLVTDFKANSHRRNLQAIQDERAEKENLYERYDESLKGMALDNIKMIERTLGRTV